MILLHEFPQSEFRKRRGMPQFFNVFYIHSIVVAVLNTSGISSYMFSPVVSSIGTEASGKESSGIRLYSAYGEITAKI